MSSLASSVPVWALLREARRRAGLSQADLAARAGTSQSAIARYERARTLPDLPTLRRVVEACGLELGLELRAPDAQRAAAQRLALERSTEERLLANQRQSELVRELRRGDPDGPALQAAQLIQLLARHRVDYVIVGGLAATVHGATRVTYDVDLVPRWTRANLERLATALREEGAELRTPGVAETSAFPVDARVLRRFEVSTWRTRLGDLDIISGTPLRARGELASYDELSARAERRDAFGETILVADLDDIIEAKEVLGREPDLVALPELHRLRELRDRSTDET